MSVTSANRLELLQIADAVAREKMIDPSLVIEAMEDSLGKAARSRYGAEYDIRAVIDPKSGELELTRHRLVVADDEIENHFTELTLEDARAIKPDAAVGDEVMVSGPNGKRFLLPIDVDEHDYLFIATGTGIAPFRGMVTELLNAGCERSITLVMGSPYRTDLLYHDFFLNLAEHHPNFHYLTAISRELDEDGRPGMYVHQRLEQERDHIHPTLQNGETLIYICGIAGMELGIFQTLARTLTGDALGRTEMLAGGIYEALITTAAGLIVAIPALILYHWLSSKIDKLVNDMDAITLEFVESHALPGSASRRHAASMQTENGAADTVAALATTD